MSLPKLPSSILVLGEEFRVEVISDLHSGTDPVSGETVGAYLRIRINADLDLPRQWTTLIHEYVHAVLHVVGIGNILSEEVEEVIAQSMEYGIVQLLRNQGNQLRQVIKSIHTPEKVK